MFQNIYIRYFKVICNSESKAVKEVFNIADKTATKKQVVKKNTFAKASLGNGIGALIVTFTPFSIFALVFAVLAVVFGVIGLRSYNSDKTVGGKNLAIAGIVLGGLYFLFVFAIMGLGFVSYFKSA